MQLDPHLQPPKKAEFKFQLLISKIHTGGNLTGLITWFHQPNVTMKEKRDGKGNYRLKQRPSVCGGWGGREDVPREMEAKLYGLS